MNALEERLDRVAYWNTAETAFKAVMDFIRNGDSWIEDKEAWLVAFKDCFPVCASFIRQLTEALDLASLLASFPQFDLTTPRYVTGGKTFFMETYPTRYKEAKRLHVKRANYVDATTGISYHLEGRAWEENGRIYSESYLDGVLVQRADYLLYKDNLMGMWRFTGSDKVLPMAFSSAENALFVKLDLLPF